MNFKSYICTKNNAIIVDNAVFKISIYQHCKAKLLSKSVEILVQSGGVAEFRYDLLAMAIPAI